MPNQVLANTEDVLERVRTRLGGTAVEVELQEGDIRECIRQTLGLYNQMRPGKRRAKLSVSIQQKRYVLVQADGTTDFPGLAGVVDVQFITRRTQPSQVDPFDPFDTALAGMTLGSGSGETFGEIEQRLGYSEQAGKIVDSEPEFDALWEGSEYVIYMDIPRSHIEAGFEYSFYYSEDSDANTGLQLIPQGDVSWFMNYVTAVAKTIVGRKRAKFGGIANPDGGVDELDSTAMLEEGKEEMTTLREELESRRVPLAPARPE